MKKMKENPNQQPNIIQAAVLEFRKFKSESRMKLRTEWIKDLKDVKKEHGSYVTKENGRTVVQLINNNEMKARKENSIKLLPTVIDNMKARFSQLKEVIQKVVKSQKWQIILGIVEKEK